MGEDKRKSEILAKPHRESEDYGTMPRHQPSARKDSKLSPKEDARQMRRTAYLKAKELTAVNPRLIALREAAKQRRRAAYAAAKERRKATAAALKAKKQQRRIEERANKDAALMKLLRLATSLE